MKNKYRREILQISYWCVSLEDIKAIFDFFKSRVDETKFINVALEANFLSGDNVNVERIDDFLDHIESRIKEKEDLISIEMQILYNGIGLSPDKRFKDIFLRINFEDNWSEFEVRASDDDGSLRDWTVEMGSATIL